MRPKGNGLITLHDENTKERGFFCMQLVCFISEDKNSDWDERFIAAMNGNCAYKDRCPIYERTIKKRGVQLNLFNKKDRI